MCSPPCMTRACSTCCCRSRSAAAPPISSPSIRSSRRSRRPMRARPGASPRRRRARTPPAFSLRKSRGRSSARPMRWWPGDRLPASPRRRRRRRLPRHRQMAVRERQRQRHLDGRAFDRFRCRRPAAARSGRPPVNRTMLFRKEQADIKDSWHVIGLRGTASNDYEVADLFVREAYTHLARFRADRREQGPLYNIPMLTLYGVGFSGVALGIAARMPRSVHGASRRPRSPAAAWARPAAARQRGGAVAGRARDRPAAVGARVSARRCSQEIWETSSATGTFSLEQRAHLRVAITGAMDRGPQGRRLRLSGRRHHRDLPGQPVRAALSRYPHGLWRRDKHTCRISNPPDRRCSAASRARGCSTFATTPRRASGAAARRAAPRPRA